MKRLITICAVVVIMCALPNVAQATMVYSPDWRTDPEGQAPTTFQHWTFDDDDNPADPEIDLNPYGTASAEISGESYFFGWEYDYEGRSGVWRTLEDIVLEIPNTDFLPQGDSKEIWIQMTWYMNSYGGPPEEITVSPDTVTYLGGDVTDHGDDWYTQVWKYMIEPNPTSETVTFSWIEETGRVDQIVVDTICVPEPATIALLGLGSLSLIRARRKTRAS